MAMTEQLEKVCLQLDDLALQYLSKLEEYGREWETCSSDFQQGYLDLAQAKYTMGFTTISQSSYDERMKALLRMHIENNTFSISKPPEHPVESETNLRRRTAPTTSTSTSASTSTSSSASSSSSSNININNTNTNNSFSTKKKDSEWIEIERELELPEEYEMNEKKPEKPKKPNNDPLRWFGYLVSPSLRTSQKHFKTATMRIIEQANRMKELKCLEEEYNALQKKKILLLDQSIP
ncbi:hypothetical protein PHYBLDRAFT_141319 [Phycomyces blakesleeanus NRRL 1555(-)]|uniref:Vacuolar ATPase assembly protein VMA22 n=1 Tax=Phycomyces blakesleeanus (strain ATCC 8743b / DSM 1359 / FGSC 10004 / NBRC 33097 / NRRL 1555) TaxID=763407 RepID=A0A167P7Z3_PHYB8|nr:hypothetical protein PHYBLDRAFT_141319 [Phycomyces blakesleeanus NRRL 1555(-)]OAD77431.1 hypothetical protein PHYBLDRAFT_141319 [Phycomyces blakesleeanus NRRL 1555(-)]|eukprot:XP_018295471.1 hypothetical protein PHYBLDRAFT_141319 [Phycomyces blakesleeanus NRRL 1555(-)]